MLQLPQPPESQTSTPLPVGSFGPSLLSSIVEGLPFPAFIKGTDGRYQVVNRAFVRLLGGENHKVLGLTDAELFTAPGLAGILSEQDRQVIAGGQATAFAPVVITLPDGSRRQIAITRIPLPPAAEGTGGLLGLMMEGGSETGAVPASLETVARGLRAIPGILEELLSCPDVSSVCRVAVERCRERLGVERCAIFLRAGEEVRGSWGYRMSGELVDISDYHSDWKQWVEMVGKWQPYESSRWRLARARRADSIGGETVLYDEGWICSFVLQSTRGEIGLFFSDAGRSGRPLDHAQQELTAVYCSLVATVIERKRYEQDLGYRDRQFRELFEKTPSANFIMSSHGRVLACNEAFSRLLELPDIPTALKLDGRELFGGAQFARFLEMLRGSGHLDDFEAQLALSNGKNVFVNVHLSARQDEEGELVGLQGFMIDITPQKRAEAALKELDFATNQISGDAFFPEVAGHLARALDVAAAFLYEIGGRKGSMVELLGYSVYTATGRQTAFDETPFPFDELLRCDSLYLPSGMPPRMRDLLALFVPNAHSTLAMSIKDADGNVVGVIAIVDDRRLEGESRLRSILSAFASRALAEIQRSRVEERLRRSQGDFLQAQKMDAVGRLAGGIAHDFNNILTSIIGISDLVLLDMEEQSPFRGDLVQIRSSAEKAATLTRQLLAFSRKQVLQPQLLDMNRVVKGMDRILRPLIGEDIVLALRLDGGIGSIRADQGQIEQVVMNIVVNARDAMPKGGKLTISTGTYLLAEDASHPSLLLPPGRYVVVSFEDTGCGMDRETVAHIFEPFYTTKPKGKGTGLGMSTVYGIVKQSGGYVEVHSEEGTGTNVVMYLPQIEGRAEAVSSDSHPLRLEGRETILIVEDDDGVRVPLRAALARYGYAVLEARSSGEGLLICERHRSPIELMITDVIMPHMNGRELYERVMPLRPAMKVIFMSGYTDDVISQQGVLEPGLHFLQKPFTTDALLTKLREVIDAR